jgi:hypothetical protein
MRWRALVLAIMAIIGPVWSTGCQSARFVQVQQSGGVVAIPANTNDWPNYYRDHALSLIAQKCPNGYVIFEEKEEVVGQRVHTDTRTDTQQPATVLVGGTAGNPSSRGGVGLAVPTGDERQTTHQTTRTTDVTEWRIYYQAK